MVCTGIDKAGGDIEEKREEGTKVKDLASLPQN